MRESTLFNKVYGCILGGAIGDAFGIRTENMHYKDIQKQYGRVTHFDPLPKREPSTQPPMERFYPHGKLWDSVDGFHPLGRWSREMGTYTDDMRYKLLVCHTILQKRGPITGEDFANAWMNYRLMAEGAGEHGSTLSWKGPEKAYARIAASTMTIAQMCLRHRATFAGWDAPIGLIHAGNPEAAAADGYPMAVAVASALRSDATLDSVLDDVLRNADCLAREIGEFTQAPEFVGRVEKLIEIASRCESVFDLNEPIYREFLVTYPPWRVNFILEMIPCALAFCKAAKGDTEQALIGACNLGRDADTITSLVGEIMGSLHGYDAFPKEWRAKAEKQNPDPDMAQMAEDLCGIIRERTEADQKRVSDLLSMMG